MSTAAASPLLPLLAFPAIRQGLQWAPHDPAFRTALAGIVDHLEMLTSGAGSAEVRSAALEDSKAAWALGVVGRLMAAVHLAGGISDDEAAHMMVQRFEDGMVAIDRVHVLREGLMELLPGGMYNDEDLVLAIKSRLVAQTGGGLPPGSKGADAKDSAAPLGAAVDKVLAGAPLVKSDAPPKS